MMTVMVVDEELVADIECLTEGQCAGAVAECLGEGALAADTLKALGETTKRDVMALIMIAMAKSTKIFRAWGSRAMGLTPISA